MSLNNRKYAIIPTIDLNSIIMSSVIESSEALVRTSVDGSKSLLRWDGNTPNQFSSLVIYNHSEIMGILNNPYGEWHIILPL